MTVKVEIINSGNNAEDKVTLEFDKGVTRDLMRGESYQFVRGETVRFFEETHGTAEPYIDHAAFALAIEGPGAQIVRTDFNPSGQGSVDRLKRVSASFINEIDAAGGDPRLHALAKTYAEIAAMFAVKAVT